MFLEPVSILKKSFLQGKCAKSAISAISRLLRQTRRGPDASDTDTPCLVPFRGMILEAGGEKWMRCLVG
jgi:hypothetical protein